MGNKKIHYAWVVCIACTLMTFTSMGAIANGFSIYLPFIIKEFGLTNAQNSSIVTIRWISAVVFTFFASKYYKKLGYKLGTTVAIVSIAVGHLVCAFAQSYASILTGSAILGIGYGFCGMIPTSALMHRWFDKSRQLAVGIGVAGASIAVIVMPLIITPIIEQYGIYKSFRIEAIAILVLALIVRFMIFDYPEEKGLKPYGYEEKSSENTLETASKIETEKRGIAKSKKISIGIYVLCMAATFFASSGSNAVFAHITMHYTTQGYTPMQAASIMSFVGVFLFMAQLICGRIADKLGGLISTIILAVTITLGQFLATFAGLHSILINILTVVLMGFGYPLPSMSVSFWANEMASGEEYVQLVAKMQLFYTIGNMAGSNIPGLLADCFNGSYIPSLYMAMCTTAISMIVILIAYKKRGILEKSLAKGTAAKCRGK